jgi:hypothetical protein
MNGKTLCSAQGFIKETTQQSVKLPTPEPHWDPEVTTSRDRRSSLMKQKAIFSIT